MVDRRSFLSRLAAVLPIAFGRSSAGQFKRDCKGWSFNGYSPLDREALAVRKSFIEYHHRSIAELGFYFTQMTNYALIDAMVSVVLGRRKGLIHFSSDDAIRGCGVSTTMSNFTHFCWTMRDVDAVFVSSCSDARVRTQGTWTRMATADFVETYPELDFWDEKEIDQLGVVKWPLRDRPLLFLESPNTNREAFYRWCKASPYDGIVVSKAKPPHERSGDKYFDMGYHALNVYGTGTYSLKEVGYECC